MMLKAKIHFSTLEVSIKELRAIEKKQVTVVICGEDVSDLNSNYFTMSAVCRELGIKKENIRKTLSEGKVKILRIVEHKTFMGYTNY